MDIRKELIDFLSWIDDHSDLEPKNYNLVVDEYLKTKSICSIASTEPRPLAKNKQTESMCYLCQGKGFEYNLDSKCKVCDGKGYKTHA